MPKTLSEIIDARLRAYRKAPTLSAANIVAQGYPEALEALKVAVEALEQGWGEVVNGEAEEAKGTLSVALCAIEDKMQDES